MQLRPQLWCFYDTLFKLGAVRFGSPLQEVRATVFIAVIYKLPGVSVTPGVQKDHGSVAF